jgi:plasmid maintenance system killer protein
VILSFRDRDTERLFRREPVRKWGPALLEAGIRKLRMLDAATGLEDLTSAPGDRLEKLGGVSAGASGASASTTNGGCAFVGATATRTTWNWSTISRES